MTIDVTWTARAWNSMIKAFVLTMIVIKGKSLIFPIARLAGMFSYLCAVLMRILIKVPARPDAKEW